MRIKEASYQTNIIFFILILLLPLGIFLLARDDKKEYQKIIHAKKNDLSSVLDQIETSFSAYYQLISTTAELASELKEDTDSHEIFLKQAFLSSHSEFVYGIGIWYEPYLFRYDIKRYGPYIRFDSLQYEDFSISYEWNSSDYDYHKKGWYQKILNSRDNKITLTAPYFDTDYTYITFGRPFFRNGVRAGVITVDIILPMLEDFFSQFDFSSFENIYLTTDENDIIYSLENVESIGNNLKKFDLSGISDYYTLLGYSPVILEQKKYHSSFKLYGITDKNKILSKIIRQRVYFYAVYLLLWGMIMALYLFSISVKKKKNENQVLNLENTTLKDEIKRRKSAESQLQFFAFHDPVTKLFNLNSFFNTETKPLPEVDERYMIQIFLDNMKELSIILDRNIIDMLLQEFSDRLIKKCPETATQFRGTGFNFYIISRTGSEKETVSLAEKLHEEFRKTIYLRSRNVRLRVRIGITPFKKAADLNQLLNMSQSIFSGNCKRQINLYDTELQEKRSYQLALDAAMSHSNFVKELFMLYQPIVNTKDKSIAGMEALVRWKSSYMEKTVSPADFIPLAEENGYIIDLGWFVMEEAIRILVEKKIPEDWFISVNVSPLQFIELGFPDKLDKLIDIAGINKNNLKLEITESSASSGVIFFWQTVSELIERGYRLAIDDFGTGESSFYRLHTIPFDTLKIDQSFIRDVSKKSRNLDIIQSILQLGDTMNNIVIGEGIETEEIHDLLQSIGLKYGQGYLYSRPVPLEELLKL